MYTYLLGWKSLNKFYYGARYSKYAKKEDLGTTYFSSSKYVKYFIEEHGQPDIIQIRKICKSKSDTLKWESTVLRRMKVVSDDRFLNRWDNNMMPINTEGPFPFQFEKFRKKAEKEWLRKYGGKGSASDEIKEKVFTTNNKRYGIHHTLGLPQVEFSRKQKCIELYGTTNPFYSKEFQSSVVNPMSNTEIKQKHKQIMKEKDWKERDKKNKKTNIEKYGVSVYMNLPEIRAKNSKCCPLCNTNKLYNVGNFSLHMMKKHQWSKQQIQDYKNEDKKNSN